MRCLNAGSISDKLARKCNFIALRAGSAKKAWIWRGQDLKGTGWRAPAKPWPRGVSDKENKYLMPKKGFDTETVSNINIYLYFNCVQIAIEFSLLSVEGSIHFIDFHNGFKLLIFF